MSLINILARMVESHEETGIEQHTRREWMKKAALVSVGGLTVVACGSEAKSKSSPSASPNANTDAMSTITATPAANAVADAGLLNAALSLEHEAIALYTAAAGLPFMQATSAAAILGIAGTFLAHHTAHREALIAAIGELKQVNAAVAAPVQAQDASAYVGPVASKLVDVASVVRLASLKEMGAAQAYLGLIAKFTDPKLAQTSGMLGGDEAAHYGVLRAALFAVLGDTSLTAATVIPGPLPTGFLQSF